MLPRLYPIVDAANFSTSHELFGFSKELVAGGATLIQYRNKQGSAREVLSQARQLRTLLGNKTKLIMNDRADLCLSAGFDGVHVGQDDLSPEAARILVKERKWIGVSTHNRAASGGNRFNFSGLRRYRSYLCHADQRAPRPGRRVRKAREKFAALPANRWLPSAESHSRTVAP